jgi:DNA-binding beta-propeller fold protein YncE
MAVAPLALWASWSTIRSRLSRITHHASRITLVTAGLLLLICSCTPKSTGTSIALRSSVFDRVEIIGSRGVGVGQLNKPRSVAVDGQDNLYVVDMTGRVQKFSPDGAFLLSWQMPQTDLGKPKGMCRDREGNIVVVEPHYQRVNHFSPEGKLLAQWGKFGTNGGEFILPRAVAVNSHNEFFVSEYSALERVQKFRWVGVSQPLAAQSMPLQQVSPATRVWPAKVPTLTPNAVVFMQAFGQAGNAPGDFNRPEGICVDADDRVYVADSCNHRIEIFDRDGKFLRAYGQAGSGKGELSYPYDICVDKAGRQYVCEFGNSRIQIFDSHDQPLEIIGGPGAEPGQFNNPWGVALDSAGNLYVADSQNHRVQKLIRKTQVAQGSSSSSSSSSYSIRLYEVARIEVEEEEEEEQEQDTIT